MSAENAQILKALNDLTKEITRLVTQFESHEKSYNRLEENQIRQGKQLSKNTLDINTLMERQKGIYGWKGWLEKLLTPILITVILVVFGIGG